MPIPTAVKYGRVTCFSLSGANSQPPMGRRFGFAQAKASPNRLRASNHKVNNRPVINNFTGFFSRYALRKTHYAIPYGAVIADLGTPTTGQPYKFGGKELITTNFFVYPVLLNILAQDSCPLWRSRSDPRQQAKPLLSACPRAYAQVAKALPKQTKASQKLMIKIRVQSAPIRDSGSEAKPIRVESQSK